MQKERLKKLQEMQRDILVVYHPTRTSTWTNRCLFLSDKYKPRTKYNHRSILQNEIVLEFDDGNIESNYYNILNVIKKHPYLRYSLWYSGNKSFHLHLFVSVFGVTKIPLFKRTIMKYLTSHIFSKVDLRLATNNHLIRCEYGIHEKTKKRKCLIEECMDYYTFTPLPKEVYEEYIKAQSVRISKSMNHKLQDSKEIMFLLDSTKFRLKEDGRERALFALIHILKKNYKTREGLSNFMWDWYKYSGGKQLDKQDVFAKVRYHWEKNYTITIKYIRELFEEVGIGEDEI